MSPRPKRPRKKQRAERPDFVTLNKKLTKDVISELGSAGCHSAVLAEAPPGAGKSTLTVSVARGLVAQDKKLRLAIVTQTNEQADDLVLSLTNKGTEFEVARMVSSAGPSHAMDRLQKADRIVIGNRTDHLAEARIVVGTARKWQYERSRLQKSHSPRYSQFALIDEAYQMRSDMLLGVADLFDTLFCVGDPGQLDPFTTIDDGLWKGLPYAPSRAALATLRAFHPDIEPIQLPTSWRLPPSAAGVVSAAFYPYASFDAGTLPKQRELRLGRAMGARRVAGVDLHQVLDRAASKGWGYVELPEKFTVRTDTEIAEMLAHGVVALLERKATVVDERDTAGRKLTADRVAVVAAHNDQVHAVRYALDKIGQNPDELTVSTANKIQGREYDLVFVWHPLAGRRDATAFHLEAGRMCVMLSRHRQACVVVGRAGATRLLAEFPDSDPVYLDEPEKFPDGWQANFLVLQHLSGCRVG